MSLNENIWREYCYDVIAKEICISPSNIDLELDWQYKDGMSPIVTNVVSFNSASGDFKIFTKEQPEEEKIEE